MSIPIERPLDPAIEERIRQRAHELWLLEGKRGMARDYLEKAEDEIIGQRSPGDGAVATEEIDAIRAFGKRS
jgi:hypothetical protein